MVLIGTVRGMGHFISLNDKAEGVTEEKREHDGNENTSGLFSPFLEVLAFPASVEC